jgi:hypothetical protein
MWGQSWGQMIWGKQASAAVPALPGGMLLLLAGLLLWVGYRMGRRQHAPRLMAVAIGFGLALVPIAIVHATSTFGVPFSFTNGTVADATQVNQNFSALTAEINALRNQTSVLTDCDFGSRAGTLVDCALGNGGASIVAPGDNALVSAVRVPQGATITSADVWVGDTNTSTNLRVCLWGMFDSSGGFDQSIPCAFSSGSGGIQKLTITPSGGVVQGNNLSYEIVVFPSDSSGNIVSVWPTDVSLTVRSAYLHYQLP